MVEDHPLDEILNALLKLTGTFLKHNIEPPAIILLPNAKAGRALLDIVRDYPGIHQPT